jgi:hypothetical protein
MEKSSLPLAGTWKALRAGLAIARDTRKIARASSRYRKDVVRQTSEAGQALLRARTINERLQVQAKLLRNTGKSFRGTIVEIAEITRQMVTRPHDASKEASVGS